MKRPAPLPTGRTPSSIGVAPPLPRIVKVPGCRMRSDLPPDSIPGTYLKRSWRSVGLCSRMKSSVSASTTHGSFSGGMSVNVPPFTVSGRYFEMAVASTTIGESTAVVFVAGSGVSMAPDAERAESDTAHAAAFFSIFIAKM